MELQCPKCEHDLVRSGELKRHCENCKSDYSIHIACNDCGEPVKRLKACGAVNLWCDNCNELKSKKTAIYTLKDQ